MSTAITDQQFEMLKSKQFTIAQMFKSKEIQDEIIMLKALARAMNLDIKEEELSLETINSQLHFFTAFKSQGKYLVRCAGEIFDAVAYQKETGVSYTYDQLEIIKLRAFYQLEKEIRKTYS